MSKNHILKYVDFDFEITLGCEVLFVRVGRWKWVGFFWAINCRCQKSAYFLNMWGTNVYTRPSAAKFGSSDMDPSGNKFNRRFIENTKSYSPIDMPSVVQYPTPQHVYCTTLDSFTKSFLVRISFGSMPRKCGPPTTRAWRNIDSHRWLRMLQRTTSKPSCRSSRSSLAFGQFREIQQTNMSRCHIKKTVAVFSEVHILQALILCQWLDLFLVPNHLSWEVAQLVAMISKWNHSAYHRG